MNLCKGHEEHKMIEDSVRGPVDTVYPYFIP